MEENLKVKEGEIVPIYENKKGEVKEQGYKIENVCYKIKIS